MGSFIAQQPNGLYCRFSTIVDTVTHYNMTKDDYIEVCKDRLGKKRGEEEANDILKTICTLLTMFLNDSFLIMIRLKSLISA